jgi:hypothetical protein
MDGWKSNSGTLGKKTMYMKKNMVKCGLKELNQRRRVYVEIPKPARVELKCSQNPRR